MIRKSIPVIVFFTASLLLVGCGTVCGLSKGVAKGTYTAASETGKGIAYDAKGLIKGIDKTDAWIKENLW